MGLRTSTLGEIQHEGDTVGCLVFICFCKMFINSKNQCSK